MKEHADPKQIDALHRTAGTYESMTLGMRYREKFDTLLHATLSHDLQKFHSVCSDEMTKAITSDAARRRPGMTS